MPGRFEQYLAGGESLLLDGGLATQLEADGHDIGSTLWSAALLREKPEAIVNAHMAFLEAGARCLISASYQASRPGFMRLGLSAEEADRLIASSVALARQAVNEFLEHRPDTTFEPFIAASVGPYGASLHDGSEYSGNYAVATGDLRDFHARRLQLLDGTGADALACETIPDHREAEILADLLQSVQTPAWISFSCRDERCISDGTPLREMAGLLAGHPRVLAIGVNCTAPHLITPLINEIRQVAPDKAVVAYPNSGEIYTVVSNDWHGHAEPVDYAGAARDWRSAGAQLIGGCCRMTPAIISTMGKHV